MHEAVLVERRVHVQTLELVLGKVPDPAIFVARVHQDVFAHAFGRVGGQVRILHRVEEHNGAVDQYPVRDTPLFPGLALALSVLQVLLLVHPKNSQPQGLLVRTGTP